MLEEAISRTLPSVKCWTSYAVLRNGFPADGGSPHGIVNSTYEVPARCQGLEGPGRQFEKWMDYMGRHVLTQRMA